MSRFAPLLRALLCLALLLNGTVYAQAATRMAMGEVAGVAQPASEDEPPCHEGMEMAKPDAVDTASDHDEDAGQPDCCKVGSCDGFCAQHAPALNWLAPLSLSHPATEAPAYRAAPHASARLPHRHRPPIPVA